MNTQTNLSWRLDKLSKRADRLRRLAYNYLYAGFAATIIGALCYMPDPSSNAAFENYIAIPTELIKPLRDNGAALTPVPGWLLENGVGVPLWLILLLPVLITVWKLLARLNAKLWIRLLTISTTPFWLGGVIGLIFFQDSSELPEITAARIGTIVDRPGMPKAASDGTLRHIVSPYVLRPESYASVRADQARYILAQQAYLAGDAASVARQIPAMTGTWRPTDEHTRVRLAILVNFAESAGNDFDEAANRLGAATLHPTAWRAASLVFAILAALGGLSAIVLSIASQSRSNSFNKFRAQLHNLGQLPGQHI